jgi:hypothetical protein
MRSMKNTRTSVSVTAFTQAVESEIRVIQDLIKRWEMGAGSGEMKDGCIYICAFLNLVVSNNLVALLTISERERHLSSLVYLPAPTSHLYLYLTCRIVSSPTHWGDFGIIFDAPNG